jgi:hypothetical protein
MHRDYFGCLPERAQLLVLEIEQAIGSEIFVRPASRRDGPLAGPAACSFEVERGARKLSILHAADVCPAFVLTHEVLHGYRNAVLNVPSLRAEIADAELEAEGWNNDLEHLFVIPDEISMFPGSVRVWQDAFDSNAAGLAYQACLEQFGQWNGRSFKRGAMRLWMVASMTVPAWPGLAEILQLLARVQSERAARDLVQRMKTALPDKTAMIRGALDALQLDRSLFSVGSVEGIEFIRRPIPD